MKIKFLQLEANCSEFPQIAGGDILLKCTHRVPGFLSSRLKWVAPLPHSLKRVLIAPPPPPSGLRDETYSLGWGGGQIRTTGQKLWCSEYYNPFASVPRNGILTYSARSLYLALETLHPRHELKGTYET
jgi:hypothetical protein